MTGMKRLPRRKKTAKIETEEVEVEEVAETAVVVEANSEAEEDLKEDAAVKMVTAEMVKMVTMEMVKMVTVEAVVEAEAVTGMETSETMNFVLTIAVAKVAIGNDLKNMKLMKNVKCRILYFDDFFKKQKEVKEKIL